MYPVLFKIGSFSFYTHGVLAVMGIFVGSACLYYLAKREKLQLAFLFDNIVYTVLFGIIGARVSYYLLYKDQFDSPKEIFYLWEGGMVSYGGFIVGAIAFLALMKQQKQPATKWLDLAAIAFPLGMVFGRLGNVFAGEYFGISTASKLNFDGVVPVTLYEAFICLLIYAALFLIYKKSFFKKTGMILGSLLVSYGVTRFVLDFWREEKDLLWSISLGQIVSLIVALGGAFIVFKIITKGKK